MHKEVLHNDAFKRLVLKFSPFTEDEMKLLFDYYETAVDLLTNHEQTTDIMKEHVINHTRLVVFLVNDMKYFQDIEQSATILAFADDEEFMTKFLNALIDKYALETHFKYEPTKFLTPFSTEISTLKVYVNFMMLKINELSGQNTTYKVMIETLQKAFSYIFITTNLIVEGFPIEALASWRIIHELEATLILLREEKAYAAYKKHMQYALAFHRALPEEEGDKLFVFLKEEVKALGLKSKDIKKYIEYGWLKETAGFNPELHKFNFRDGLEKLAGLEAYNKTYQLASEVAHSNPLLLFSNERYFLKLTLLNIYESFFRLEELFFAFFQAFSSPTETVYFTKVRSMYLTYLTAIYTHEFNK